MLGNEAKTIKVTPSWEGLGRVPKWVEDTRPSPFTELTDLEFASAHGRTSIIKVLLDAGGDINAKSHKWATTPLRTATSYGETEAVQFLIDYGADLEVRDSLGRTCLFTAVEFRYREIVQVLLDAGANANVSDDWGVTPIMCAVSLNNIKIAKILLAAGADVNAIERNGNTVSDFVSYKRYSIPILGDFYTSERNKEMGRLLEEAKLKNGM
jgi:ankyrin repeat protein